MILGKIETDQGGCGSFDDFVRCMVEINFGYCKSLQSATGAAKMALERITCLTMMCNASGDRLRRLSQLHIGSSTSVLKGLQHLTFNAGRCRYLEDISCL